MLNIPLSVVNDRKRRSSSISSPRTRSSSYQSSTSRVSKIQPKFVLAKRARNARAASTKNSDLSSVIDKKEFKGWFSKQLERQTSVCRSEGRIADEIAAFDADLLAIDKWIKHKKQTVSVNCLDELSDSDSQANLKRASDEISPVQIKKVLRRKSNTHEDEIDHLQH